MSDPVLFKMAKERVRCWMARINRDHPALMVFMFHALVENRDELERGRIDPALCTTVREFRDFVVFFLSCGYQFVSPHDVSTGLPTDGRYILITFDDGYFNNRLALAVLHELSVPAVFCIATGYVESGKPFWWDVVYRERTKQATPPRRIAEELESVKSLCCHDVDPYLRREFGAAALHSTSDADRPLGADELAAFARQPFVHLGNHTRSHAILTNLTETDARRQIESAQEDLSRLCGVDAHLIAYPNGAHSANVRKAAAESGLVLGVTVDRRKHYLPLDRSPQTLLNLGRFQLFRDRPVRRQLEIARGDFGRHARKPRQRRAVA